MREIQPYTCIFFAFFLFRQVLPPNSALASSILNRIAPNTPADHGPPQGAGFFEQSDRLHSENHEKLPFREINSVPYFAITLLQIIVAAATAAVHKTRQPGSRSRSSSGRIAATVLDVIGRQLNVCLNTMSGGPNDTQQHQQTSREQP